jgi:hypothetical protein
MVDGSEWIVDRLPTKKDADKDGEVQVMWRDVSTWTYVPVKDVMPGIPWRTPVSTVFVSLTYFLRRSGEYRAESSIEVLESASFSEILDEVQELRKSGKLPGRSQGEYIGGSEYIVLVSVPYHSYNKPYLII